MATIPTNPTWTEIRAGMEAARAAYRNAETAGRAAAVIVKQQRLIVGNRQADMRVAMNDLRQWEAAVRRKLLAGN